MVVDGKNITLTFGCTGQLSINNATLRNFPFNGCTNSSNRVLYNQHFNCKKYWHGSVIYQFQHIKDWFLIANVRNLSQTSFAAATPVIPILLCLSFDHLTNYKGNFCSIDICRRHQSCICFRVYTGRRL